MGSDEQVQNSTKEWTIKQSTTQRQNLLPVGRLTKTKTNPDEASLSDREGYRTSQNHWGQTIQQEAEETTNTNETATGNRGTKDKQGRGKQQPTRNTTQDNPHKEFQSPPQVTGTLRREASPRQRAENDNRATAKREECPHRTEKRYTQAKHIKSIRENIKLKNQEKAREPSRALLAHGMRVHATLSLARNWSQLVQVGHAEAARLELKLWEMISHHSAARIKSSMWTFSNGK